MIDKSRISLKAVKYMASLSEETYCYTATLCVDGVAVGTVGNDGHGGETVFHGSFTAPSLKKAEEVGLNSMDKLFEMDCNCEFVREGEGCIFCHGTHKHLVNIAWLADTLMTEYLREKEEKKILNRYFANKMVEAIISYYKDKYPHEKDRLP